MGAIAGILGLNGGVNGTGAQRPDLTQANLTNAAQLGSAYTGNQTALQQQQALLQAIQGQNGLGNQSQVYGQLQGIAAGTGPNPAQAMLNQATGQNVANQAALMAGQRGAGANPALIARQAAQQGANLQQQAVGQGATMQAQQALNAIGAAGNLANQQAANQMGAVNANTAAQQAEQAALLNAQNATNQQVTGFNQSQLTGQMSQQGGLSNIIASSKYTAQGGFIEDAPTGPSSMIGKSLLRYASGGNVGGRLKAGGNVPGKPKHPGNDYRNDTVKAMLSPGEVVIPNSVMQSKDPVRGAAAFVQAQLAKKRK